MASKKRAGGTTAANNKQSDGATARSRPSGPPSKGPGAPVPTRRVTADKRRQELASPPPPPPARGRRLVLPVVAAVLIGGGAVAAWALGAFGPRATATAGTLRTQDVELIPDRAGPIERWVMFLGDVVPELATETHAGIMAAARPESRFSVVYSNPVGRSLLEEALERHDFDLRRISWIASQDEVPPWSRDQFLVGRDRAGAPVLFLHHPDHYSRIFHGHSLDGRNTPRILHKIPDVRFIETRARIEGGSMVSDLERVFITPIAMEVAVEWGEFPDEKSFLSYLQGLYGRPVTVLNTRKGFPAGHADLFMAAIGDKKLILGDPRLAVELLDALDEGQRLEYVTRLNELLRGVPESDPLTPYKRSDILARLRQSNTEAPLLAGFDAVEAQLRGLGYELIKVPFLGFHLPSTGMNQMISYTNAVQEEVGGEKIAYVPRYGLPPLDRAGLQTWEELGYRVRAIEATGPSMLGGGVRCISQQIRAK